MFDILSHAMLDGLLGAEPLVQVKDRKFLCPVPGKETLLVEQNSYTMSGCPALAQADRMSGRTAGALG